MALNSDNAAIYACTDGLFIKKVLWPDLEGLKFQLRGLTSNQDDPQ